MEQASQSIGQPVNVGVDSEISILELAEKVIQLTKSNSSIQFIPYAEAYSIGFEDMLRRVPDNNLLKQLTGWTPIKNIEDIILDIQNSLLLQKTI